MRLVIYACIALSKNVERIKYQISLDRTLSFDYLDSFLDNKNDNLFTTAQKILNGFNENEVHITEKNLKRLSFFEKFFNFFN